MKNLTFLTFFLFWGCSGAGVVEIKTNPSNALIKVINKGGEISEIGTSPHRGSLGEFFAQSNYVELVVEKEEFDSQRVILARPYLETDFNLSFDLKKSSNRNSDDHTLERVSIKIAEIYRKIQVKDFSNAVIDLRELRSKHPNLSIVHDLLGNISYLSGNYEEAKSYYLKAASLQPNNYERSAILKKIEQRIIQ